VTLASARLIRRLALPASIAAASVAVTVFCLWEDPPINGEHEIVDVLIHANTLGMPDIRGRSVAIRQGRVFRDPLFGEISSNDEVLARVYGGRGQLVEFAARGWVSGAWGDGSTFWRWRDGDREEAYLISYQRAYSTTNWGIVAYPLAFWIALQRKTNGVETGSYVVGFGTRLGGDDLDLLGRHLNGILTQCAPFVDPRLKR
jgi:hypothetical protein